MTGIARTAAMVLACAAVALLWRPTSITAQTALLEVDKGEVKLLQVNDDAGLVVRGALNSGLIPATGAGVRLMWHPSKAAFRAGQVDGSQWDDGNIGQRSVAMGYRTTANGVGSTALGSVTTARGSHSTAMGTQTMAIGQGSTAMGSQTTAEGVNSTAMGSGTTAGGETSIAMGGSTTATGQRAIAVGTQVSADGENAVAIGMQTRAIGVRSTAVGYRTAAAGDFSTVMGSEAATSPSGTGSFVFGDASSTNDVVSNLPNEFVVRAAGGFRFRTNASLSTGCDLVPGAADWACTSSRLAKEGFEDVDGEQVLGKLATMSIQRWRYIGTEAAHVGPTAEDFHAAFGLGLGPTTISTMDADGISLRAIQELERRTAELREENADLRRRLEALEAERAERK